MSEFEIKIPVTAKQLDELSGGDAPLTDYDDNVSDAWVLGLEAHKYLINKLSDLGQVAFEAAASIVEDAYDSYIINNSTIHLEIENNTKYFINIYSSDEEEFERICKIVNGMLGKFKKSKDKLG